MPKRMLAEFETHLAVANARISELRGAIAELKRARRRAARERELLAAFIALRKALRFHRGLIAKGLAGPS